MPILTAATYQKQRDLKKKFTARSKKSKKEVKEGEWG
jgi:hypothetical protein